LHKGVLAGELKVGVIPTLAPYLLPLFIPSFTKNYPNVKLIISEMTTDIIINKLREGKIDVGILVTPLNEPGIKEQVLFYEEMLAYVSAKNAAYKKTYVLPQDIDPNKLWLLEEGHCFRGQVENLCSAKSKKAHTQLNYQSGSFETLKAMVDNNYGYTLIPELAVGRGNKHVKHFTSPEPVREVSLAVHNGFVKERLLEKLRDAILKAIPAHFKKNEKFVRVRWK
jgi:LysR family hydrogen peroxide-inducible transcriptional activator